MKSEPLISLDRIDLGRVLYDAEAIRQFNPHRFEMELLDAIVHFDPETLDAVGYHDLDAEAFWVRGHIPGRPIFPGALMVESAAQLSSFCYRQRFSFADRFFGFGGIDNVRFRSVAEPGQRIYVICKQIVLNRRHSRFAVQGIVEDRIAFDGEIIGVSIPIAQARAAASEAAEGG